MTEALLALVPVYGPALIGLATFLSCLALPIPASILMLAGGAFAAGGDLTLWTVALAALAGAIAGDQTGFALGRGGGRVIERAVKGRPGREALMSRAEAFAAAKGGMGVFLSRWLFSPLGPYVNVVAGAAAMPWRGFTLAGVLGEAVWVTLYTGAGFLFAGHVEALANVASNLTGALAAALVAAILGAALLHLGRERRVSGGSRGRGT